MNPNKMMDLQQAHSKRCIIMSCLLVVANQSLASDGKILAMIEPHIQHSSHGDWSMFGMADVVDDHEHDSDMLMQDCEPPEQDDHYEFNSGSKDTTSLHLMHFTQVPQVTHLEVSDHVESKKGTQTDCYVAYELVDHGAIFNKMDTKNDNRINQQPKTVFLQPKIMISDNLDKRKKQLIQKFPVKNPKLAMLEKSQIDNSLGGEKFKIIPGYSSGVGPNNLPRMDLFVMKSPDHSNEINQQFIHQTEINQFAGELAVTESSLADMTNNGMDEGFDVSLLHGTNKALVPSSSSSGRQNSSIARGNDTRNTFKIM